VGFCGKKNGNTCGAVLRTFMQKLRRRYRSEIKFGTVPAYTTDINTPSSDWEARIAALWKALDDHAPEDFVAKIESLAAEQPKGDAAANFERACAQDSTGHSDKAVPLYQAALATGLTGIRRRRATIQLASSLRNVGDVDTSIALLQAELLQPSDELDGAVRGFLALALVEAGREREAVGHSLHALSKYLPRYNRSLAAYASEYMGDSPPD
jgi:tetratricopeptide (TPR) repeat protein